jgi:RNA polymerase sigma-70 factor (ECF subfamily)
MWRRADPDPADVANAAGATSAAAAFDLAAVIADQHAFPAWYDVAAPRVYAYALGRTGSVTIAEEITQETFIEVVRNPRTFDGRSDPLPWLIGVARHRLGRHFRSARRDDARADELVREIRVVEGGGGALTAVEDRDDLTRGLAALSPDQRAALMLRFVDGLSVREVAQTIGRTEDATESLIRRARQTFESAFPGGRRAS